MLEESRPTQAEDVDKIVLGLVREGWRFHWRVSDRYAPGDPDTRPLANLCGMLSFLEVGGCRIKLVSVSGEKPGEKIILIFVRKE